MLMSLRSLFLLLLGGVSWCRGVDILAEIGSDVAFTTDVSQRPSEITWFRDTTIIVELEEGRPPNFYRLADRVTANLETGTFILNAVTPEDSGQYKADRVVGGRISTDYFTLKVLGPVCQVKIHNTTVENNVTLQCMCPDQSAPPKYKWVNESDHVVSEDRPLTVQKTKEPQRYRCKASNDVSRKEAIVTVPSLTDPARPLPAGAVVGIIIGLLILILAGVGLVLWKLNKLNHLINLFGRGSKRNGNQPEIQTTPEQVALKANTEEPNSP